MRGLPISAAPARDMKHQNNLSRAYRRQKLAATKVHQAALQLKTGPLTLEMVGPWMATMRHKGWKCLDIARLYNQRLRAAGVGEEYMVNHLDVAEYLKL